VAEYARDKEALKSVIAKTVMTTTRLKKGHRVSRFGAPAASEESASQGGLGKPKQIRTRVAANAVALRTDEQNLV